MPFSTDMLATDAAVGRLVDADLRNGDSRVRSEAMSGDALLCMVADAMRLRKCM